MTEIIKMIEIMKAVSAKMKKEEKSLVETDNSFWGKIKCFFSKIFRVKMDEKNDAKDSQIDIANELQEADTSTAKQKLPEFVLEYKQDIVAENQRLLKIKNDFDNYLIDEKDIDIKVEYLSGNNLKVMYEGAKAVTPGQFCVLYLGDTCLGGGMIKEVYK